MIIYSSSAEGFRNDVDDNKIVEKIETAYLGCVGRRPGDAERNSWRESLVRMESVIRRAELPGDCGVLIEYIVPPTSKRVDFLITGKNDEGYDNFVVVELKQWQKAESTDKDGVVNTFTGGANRDVAHPSYQAYSYQYMICDMNEEVAQGDLLPGSCAYLHNYYAHNPEPLLEPQYQEYLKLSPVFFADDVVKLRDFLKRHVGKGKGMETLYRIENGKIRPSKMLVEHVSSLLEGNQEFILLDEQKVAFSWILRYAGKQTEKHTIIVKGGPGTGKSVLSVNALAALLKKELNVRFVAPNAAFRSVILEMLKGKKGNSSRAKVLFSGSGSYLNSRNNEFDVLIVDEAHRLKNGTAFMYKGDNQVEDIIRASRTNVFFVDDSQMIRTEDIGSAREIRRVAEKYGSAVHEIELKSQFRCSGADGFLNWLDSVLQIREITGNFTGWDQDAFEFRLMDSPQEVYEAVQARCAEGFKARMLAGFAWKWTADKEGNAHGEIEDVSLPEYGFSMPWNGRDMSTTWAVHPNGINQIGCIHTSQGLEFDYAGVIIGNDLRYDPKRYAVFGDYEEYMDTGGKKGLAKDPEKLTRFVSNIYKVLMSRGMKGCYVFCRDENLRKYLNERLEAAGRE